jgi:flavin reductase
MTDVKRSALPDGCAGVDEAALRAARALYPTGITVLGAYDGDRPHAMTAGSFVWVSLDPPLVLVCVRHGALTGAVILRSGAFAVSVLAAGQEPLARHFADPRRPPGHGQFATIDWWPAPITRAPILGGCLAWFDCRLDLVTAAGDHDVLFGRVLWASGTRRRDPLVHFARGYRPLSPVPTEEDDDAQGERHG